LQCFSSFLPRQRLLPDQRDFAELFQGGFQVLDDLLGENLGIGKVIGVFEVLVSQPENIETGLVAADEILVIVRPPAAFRSRLGPSRFALMAVFWIIILNELVEVFALQRIGFQSEVFVGPEIIDPELFRPRRFAGGLLVKEEDVGFDALCVE
jgi:hypothetical protein